MRMVFFVAALVAPLRADPLADAIEQADLTPGNSGSQGWTAQTIVNHDGFDAAQSGAVGDGQQSVMELSVAGPGPLSFWWKVSSEAAAAALTFTIDGVVQGGAISGETDWQQRSATLDAGNHVLRWTYTKNAAVSSGSDCGWVDELVIPVQGPPVIAAQPAATTVVSGENAILTISAGGGALQYQWYRGSSGDTSAPIPGATGSTLLTPVLRANAGFWVRVSNTDGSCDSLTSTVTLAAAVPARLMACGRNSYGQLGDGSTTDRSTPVQIAGDVVSVAAGTAHNLFVKTDGSLWGMGLSQSNVLGNSITGNYISPVHVADDVAIAAAGYAHSLFVKTDGSLWGVGANGGGQLGTGPSTGTSPAAPVQVASGVTAAVAGGNHSLFLKLDGSLWATGYNFYGQLGDGTKVNRLSPVQIATGVQAISAGYNHSVFVKTDGTLWAMGDNTYGQLGDGSSTSRSTPVQVASGVVSAAAAVSHTLFLKANGTLWAMGSNTNGMLGDGTTTNRSTPVQVASGVRSAAGGGSQSMFLRADASLWAMGSNMYGQLGDGITTNRSIPVRVASAVTSMALGAFHSLYRDMFPTIAKQPVDTGTLPNGSTSLSVTPGGVGPWTYQWYQGKRGDTSQPLAGAASAIFVVSPSVANANYWVRISNAFGAVNSRTVLVEIVTPPAVTALSGPPSSNGDSSVLLAVTASGGMLSYQWYDGAAGDTSKPILGATSALMATPPLRTDHAFWVRVSNSEGSADSETLTVTTGAAFPTRLTAWGYNNYGQLGDGTTVDRATPVMLMGEVAAAAGGGSHSLYLKTDGTLWAMGDNGIGQLGDGTIISRLAAVSVANGVRAIAGGNSHSLFVRTDGTLWATGNNYYGQLGDGTTTRRITPVQIATDVITVAAGYFHSLFLKSDGTLWAMGSNASGQLGDGTSTNRSTPVQVASGVIAIVALGSHSLYLKTDSTLWGMGDNSYGQLGGPATTRATPGQIASGMLAMAGGVAHSLFLKLDGTLWAMGRNNLGQLGDGTTIDRPSACMVASGVANVAAGYNHSLFLKTDGTLWAMGYNEHGQLGDGTTSNRSVPVQVASAVNSMACGGSHNLVSDMLPAIGTTPGDIAIPAGATPTLTVVATATSPMVYQWYRGETGDTSQVIPGATSASFITPPLTNTTRFWVRIANAYGYSDSRAALVQVVAPPAITAQSPPQTIQWPAAACLTISASSDLLSYQWYEGIAGDITKPVTGASGPQLLTQPLRASTSFWVRVSNAAGHADSATIPVTVGAAIPAKLLGCGQNGSAQLGDGTKTGRSTPVVIANDVAIAAAGRLHSLFVKSDGSLWAMGSNSYGQLGDSTSSERSTQVRVATDVLSVAAGTDHNLVLKTDGSLWAMGHNEASQLGDGTTATRSAPVQVATGVITAAAGYSHSLFVKTDGTLWATGSNGSGQLGDGTTANRSTPQQVAGNVVAVTAGYLYSLFLKTDGSLWAMGFNNYGQLGDGTTTSRSTPVQVASGVMAAAAGYSHSLFVKADGTLWATGYNGSGQLGDGTTTNRSSPVQVASGVLTIDAGEGHSMFVKADGALWAMGYNYSGQLGDGSNTNRTTPVRVATGVGLLSLGGSHSLMLDVRPSIGSQPVDTPTCLGGTPTLSVIVTGAPTLAYQWYRGSSGDTSEAVPGATATTFTTPPNTTSSNYWLRSSNAYGTVDSRTVFVQVVAPPALTGQPGPQSVASNTHAFLSITVLGELLTYQWYEGNSGDTTQPVTGATGTQLVTPPLRANTAFWMRVSNVAGHANSDSIPVTIGTATPTRLFACGSNTSYQLGNATVTRSLTPAYVTSDVVSAAAGSSHSLFLKADGMLWGAGSNNSGQLGINSINGNTLPVQMASDVTAVAAGGFSSFFIKTDGSLWGLGDNSYGELGADTPTLCDNPVQVASNVLSATTSGSHTFFIKTDGTLWAAGNNNFGQLGDGTKTSRNSPVQVASNVLAAAAGASQSFFLKTDGTLWAVGNNNIGQLGDGTTTNRAVPVQVASAVAAVAAGDAHSLFLKVDGSLWATGSNIYSQLGDGSTTERSTPIKVATGVRAMAAGKSHSLFLKADGSLWAMGSNTSGQLGDGTTTSRSTPVQVASAVTSLAMGASHSLFCSLAPAILTQPADTGIVANTATTLSVAPEGVAPLTYQWYRGIVGDTSQALSGATSASFTTPSLTSDTSYWVRVSTSYGAVDSRTVLVTIVTQPQISALSGPPSLDREDSAALSVTATGGVLSYQWFEGASGDTSTPVAGATGSQLTTHPLRSNISFWVRVSNAAGSSDSQTLPVTVTTRPPARLMACGSNEYGQLGDGTTTFRRTPVRVASDVAAVATGPGHSLFVTTTGTLWSTGDNSYGQLGLTADSSIPLPVTTGVMAVAAGNNHSLFLKTDGSLWAMGANHSGQLGNGTSYSRSTPVQVATGVVAMAAAANHSLFVKADGSLWAMGNNSFGQLGDGSRTSRSTPAQVTTGVAAVTAGTYHSLFVKTNGTLWAMGDNGYGQLGTGTTSSIATPRQVASGVLSVDTGTSHSLFVKTDGTLWAMGNNNDGQLGDATHFNRPTPVQVASGVLRVAAGGAHSMFVKTDKSLWATGSNSVGQLANGSYYDTTTPVKVANSVTSLALGDSHSLYCDIAPLIGTQPADTGTPSGGTATLSVAPLGDAPFTYQWYLGTSGNTSQPVAGATSAIFTTASLTLAASYWVRVSNAQGAVDSRTTLVQIVTPPQFTALSGPLAVDAGKNAALTATVAGGVLSYQWHEGAGGDTSTPVPGATGAQLLSPPLWTSTSFWLRVANAAGSADSSAILVTVTPRLATRQMACGSNATGQLGDDTTTNHSAPLVSAGDVLAMDAGDAHSLFLKADGSLWAMGSNAYGQLGDATPANHPTPLEVNADVLTFSAGGYHSQFVTTDGTLWAMGYNSFGGLGIGTTNNTATPTQVTNHVLSVAAGKYHSLLIKTDGTLWGMGYNITGALGDETITHRSIPVPIAAGVATAAAGASHSLFVKTDGSLWAMGSNGSGRLGDGTTITRITPVKIATGVIAIAAGASHSLFLKTDGSLWAMGSNTSGQLGDGTTANRSTPVQVVASGVVDVAAGASHSMFLKTDGSLWAMGSNVYGQLGDGSTIDHPTPVQVASAVASLALGASHSLFRVAASDVAINVTASPAPIAIDGHLTFTISTTNHGPLDASGVIISDILPPELAFVSAAAPSGWTSSVPAVDSNGLITFSKTSSLSVGGSATFTIVAKVRNTNTNGTMIHNSADVAITETDLNPANNVGATSTAVGTVSPTPVQLASVATVSRQTGLFQLAVNVTNTTPLPINGFRLHVDYHAYQGAYPSLRLYNASSPQGSADVFVDFPYPVAVDGTVPVNLAFYTSTRTFPDSFAPVLTVEAHATSAVPTTNGSGVQPIFTKLPNRTVLLEFPTVTGNWYQIRYSADLVNWFDSPVPIQAGGTRTQWIDSGAPLTHLSPADPAVTSRFYRVNEIRTP